jgi:hypothetical protein
MDQNMSVGAAVAVAVAVVVGTMVGMTSLVSWEEVFLQVPMQPSWWMTPSRRHSSLSIHWIWVRAIQRPSVVWCILLAVAAAAAAVVVVVVVVVVGRKALWYSLLPRLNVVGCVVIVWEREEEEEVKSEGEQ